jgi:hypothetical protein
MPPHDIAGSAGLNIDVAQKQMRHAYYDGAPAMLVSGAVWATAGAIAGGGAFGHAVWALFIGGIAIHPLGMLLARLLGRPGGARGNPLDRLAFEATVTMLLCLPLAYALSLQRPAWFFPAMLLIIGGRYVVFASIYGLRLYWACGAALVGVAWLSAIVGLPPASTALAGAAIEAAFAAALFVLARGRGARETAA